MRNLHAVPLEEKEASEQEPVPLQLTLSPIIIYQVTSRLLLRPHQLRRLALCKPHQGVLPFPYVLFFCLSYVQFAGVTTQGTADRFHHAHTDHNHNPHPSTHQLIVHPPQSSTTQAMGRPPPPSGVGAL